MITAFIQQFRTSCPQLTVKHLDVSPCRANKIHLRVASTASSPYARGSMFAHEVNYCSVSVYMKQLLKTKQMYGCCRQMSSKQSGRRVPRPPARGGPQSSSIGDSGSVCVSFSSLFLFLLLAVAAAQTGAKGIMILARPKRQIRKQKHQSAVILTPDLLLSLSLTRRKDYAGILCRRRTTLVPSCDASIISFHHYLPCRYILNLERSYLVKS